MGCPSLLQEIFLSQRSNPGLLHCRQILYCLNHQGSPYIILGYKFTTPDLWRKVENSFNLFLYLCHNVKTLYCGLQGQIWADLSYFTVHSTFSPGPPQDRAVSRPSHQCFPVCESEVAQSCPTLCNPMDCSLPGFSIHGIFQARILEWVAFPFFREYSQPRDWTQVSHIAGRRFNLWATREARD